MLCQSGNRSGTAAAHMVKMGFKNVCNIIGGIMAWEGKVVYPKAAQKINLLKLPGFGKRKEKILSYLDKSAIIIDVLIVEEYKMGHITPSQNIVLDQIDRHIKKLKNRNLPVITCCKSVYRSGIA